MAVTTVAAYNFALAVLVSDSTATGGMDAFVWAGIHSAFIVALALLLMVSWRLDAPTRQPGDGERFRLSFERSPIGMAVVHPSGDFIEVNQAMADMLGYEVRHLIGSNVRGVVHSDDLADLGAAWEAMGNEEGHSAAAWMRFMTSAGRSIWGRLSLSLVAGAPLQRAMVLLQIEDVTHTHLEQRRLEELIRGKDEFVATVGEEMREPLGLLIDLSDESEIDARLSRIGCHAREISVVLDDLIVSARADTTPPLMTPQPVDAAVLCREVVEHVPAAVEVSTDIRASTLWADPEVVRHILAGLIGNAVRYGGPNVSLRACSGPTP
jgi:PAS domain S-box-containing protein